MIKSGSYVRLLLNEDPPRYRYGQVLFNPFNDDRILDWHLKWVLKWESTGEGFGYMMLGRELPLDRLEEITAQEYFLFKLKNSPSER